MKGGENMEIASLIAGLGAVALYLLCFQLKEAKKLLACRFLSSILYVVQYLLLFAFVGAAMDASAAVTSYFAYKKDAPWVKKYKILILIVTNLAIIAVGILLYENIFSLLPIAGVLLESAAGWMKNEKRIRIVSLFAVPCWLVYNVISRAYGSVIGSVLAFISIIVALIRYSKKKKSVQNNEVESAA